MLYTCVSVYLKAWSDDRWLYTLIGFLLGSFIWHYTHLLEIILFSLFWSLLLFFIVCVFLLLFLKQLKPLWHGPWNMTTPLDMIRSSESSTEQEHIFFSTDWIFFWQSMNFLTNFYLNSMTNIIHVLVFQLFIDWNTISLAFVYRTVWISANVAFSVFFFNSFAFLLIAIHAVQSMLRFSHSFSIGSVFERLFLVEMQH